MTAGDAVASRECCTLPGKLFRKSSMFKMGRHTTVVESLKSGGSSYTAVPGENSSCELQSSGGNAEDGAEKLSASRDRATAR